MPPRPRGADGGERKTRSRGQGPRARTSSGRWARPYHRKLPRSRRGGNRFHARSRYLPNRAENSATRRGAAPNVSSVPAIRNRASIGASPRGAETARRENPHAAAVRPASPSLISRFAVPGRRAFSGPSTRSHACQE